MDKKTEFVERLSAQMVEWDAQIDLLKFKEDSAAEVDKSEYRRQIDALLNKRKDAELKLQGMPASSADPWEELKAGSETVWDAVRSSVHDTIVKIK